MGLSERRRGALEQWTDNGREFGTPSRQSLRIVVMAIAGGGETGDEAQADHKPADAASGPPANAVCGLDIECAQGLTGEIVALRRMEMGSVRGSCHVPSL